MSYSDIPIPNRSQHLWKYTPWNKIHPTKYKNTMSMDRINTSGGDGDGGMFNI